MTPQECLYESAKDKLPPGTTLAHYEKLLKGWEIIPIYEGSELIGTAIRKDTELHVGFVKQGHCIRKDIKRTIGTILKEEGFVTTIVRSNNLKGLRFCERLGFEREWEQDGLIFLKLTRCKYV